MDDLYGDLEDTDATEEFDKIRTKNQILEDENTQLKRDLYGSTEKCGILETENEQLKNNISVLFKTAQGEIFRKDKTIDELRSELENLKFRRLGSHNKQFINQNPNRCNPQVNPKNDFNVKPQPIITKLCNPSIIEPERDSEKQQTLPVSGFNESRPNNAFTCNSDYEDPRLQRIFSNNNSDRNIPTMIDSKQKIDVKWHLRPVSPSLPCREERTAELQPENLYGNIVPKRENELITQLLPNYDTVKTEDLDILELDTKQEEFCNDKDIPEINVNTDRKRKRCSLSPLRKIPKRNTPDSGHRKNSPGKNRHRLVSKSRSRENYTSKERQSRSPHSTRRFSRNNDRSIDNTRCGRSNQDKNSRNRERSHPRKKRISFKSSDHNNELRDSDNRRRNYEENDHGRERRGVLNNDDRKKVDQYGRKSSPQCRETYKDHRNKQISSNFNSSVCSKDSNENENKRLSAKNDNFRERGKEKFSEQGLSSNISANHDDFNDRNAHFRKKSPSAKDFEPLKHMLNLYINSEKDTKHQDYDKKRNYKAVSGVVKKKALSLEEYNKRHNSTNESDITDAEIKKGSTTKVNSNSGCVELKNIRVDNKSDPPNEYVDIEDGEVLSDQETDLLQNLEERVDHQIQEPEHHHIVPVGNPVTSKKNPKKSSLSESQSSADKIVDACSNSSKLAEIKESKKIHKSKRSGNYSFSNETKETNATHSPHLKLLSDVACDSRASSINNDDRFKTDDSNNIEELKPRNEEDIVTNTLSDPSAENIIGKYIHKKKCVPIITVIDVEPSECPILPSVSASANRKDKTILHENTTIKKSKISDYENKKLKINSSAAKCDKTPNSSKLSKKLNTTDTSSRTHFNKNVPTKIKSKPIHDVPEKNSCETSNEIMTQYKNNESIYQFVTLDKAVNNSEEDEQIARACRSPKEKCQNTPVDVSKSSSKISMGLLSNKRSTSKTVPRNSRVSESPDDSVMNYSEIIPTGKCDSNVTKNVPIIGGTRETVSKNSIQLYNNIVDDSLMNDLMKISQSNFTDIQICGSKVPELIPVIKDSRESIPKKKDKLSNTAVYDSLMKDFTNKSQNNSPHPDVPKALPIIRDASEDISDKSKKLYHDPVYDSLIINIKQLSQNNTSVNKILGDSLIKDNVETCQTITTDIIESFIMKETDLPISNIINSLHATSATVECDGKLLNNPPISEKLDVSLTIFPDSLYNSKLLGNTPVVNKQIMENECQTIKSPNTSGTKILGGASNKNVELVSDVFPINLIQHFDEILDYSYTKGKTFTADCDTAGSKILENVSVVDKVNIPPNIDESENKIFFNSLNTNNINSVQNSILPVEKTIENHDTNMNKTVAKVEPPKTATTNSNTVHFKITRRRNVAIKSSHTK